MDRFPRIALLADTFHEVNGAARTCREWEAFAQRRRLPFFCARWGTARRAGGEPPVRTLELVRSRLAFRVDPDLHFDPMFGRALEPIQQELERFRPDFIHITSPGDLGIAGAILAARLKTPLALSWHTNLHEFAERRVARMLAWAPQAWRARAARAVERFVLDRVCWFFGRGSMLLAPNPELVRLLSERTGAPVFQMRRGIDNVLFRPERRTRSDSGLVLGYVGRLMPEKNLRLLPRVAAALETAGVRGFRFQITGAGSERAWLEQKLTGAEFTGVLRGEALARAYANMDIFLFPSRTDTYGNVIQEAMASGVAAVATSDGGPRFLVRHGATGLIASTDEEFCEWAVLLARDANLRREMAQAALRQIAGQTWDAVFEEVYESYACAPSSWQLR